MVKIRDRQNDLSRPQLGDLILAQPKIESPRIDLRLLERSITRSNSRFAMRSLAIVRIPLSAKTLDDGTFEAVVDPGVLKSASSDQSKEFQLSIRMDTMPTEFIPTSVELNITDLKNKNIQPLNITLQSGIKVSGQIVDEDGAPVAGVQIGPIALSSQLRAFATSDVEGRFEMYLLPGKYRLYFASRFASPRGMYDLPIPFEISSGNPSDAKNYPHFDVDIIRGQPVIIPVIRVKNVLLSTLSSRFRMGNRPAKLHLNLCKSLRLRIMSTHRLVNIR